MSAKKIKKYTKSFFYQKNNPTFVKSFKNFSWQVSYNRLPEKSSKTISLWVYFFIFN